MTPLPSHPLPPILAPSPVGHFHWHPAPRPGSSQRHPGLGLSPVVPCLPIGPALAGSSVAPSTGSDLGRCIPTVSRSLSLCGTHNTPTHPASRPPQSPQAQDRRPLVYQPVSCVASATTHTRFFLSSESTLASSLAFPPLAHRVDHPIHPLLLHTRWACDDLDDPRFVRCLLPPPIVLFFHASSRRPVFWSPSNRGHPTRPPAAVPRLLRPSVHQSWWSLQTREILRR